ncbi:MAG TPA: TolC family outer membrane protein [Steroidobacteraceae bacterium]|jgi:outer membrane protein|nr:TolC family outer membrane protein [Steroidobacteraceae bacterium]
MYRAAWTSSLALLCAGLVIGNPATAADFAQVYQDALANDPTFQQAHATYMAAREARPEAWALLLPQISGSAGKSWEHTSGVNTQVSSSTTGAAAPFSFHSTDRISAKQWSLNLSENLFSWADWMGLKAADSQVAQAQATYQAAAQNLVLRVATAYFNVLSALDTLQAQQSSLQAFDLQLQQANKRYQVGLIAITDVEQARAARDTAAAAVIADKEALASAQDQLEVITGRQYDTLSEPGADMPLVMPNPANQNTWVQTSLQQNLTLIASRLAADVARANVRIAFGGHLPTLSLIASRSFNSSSTDESIVGIGSFNGLPGWANDRQIGLQVTVPIFSGGGTEARVHQAQYQWIAAKDAVEQASRSTVQQARDAYLGVISGIAHVQALQQALTSSQTAYKATEAGYRVGTQTEVDVLNALSTLVQAKTNYASSRYAYITSVVQLRYAAGTLDPSEVRAIDRWLTAPASVSPGAITPEAMTPPAAAPTPKPPQ